MNAHTDIIHLSTDNPDLAPSAAWSDMRSSDHFVQFYEQDSFLLDSLGGYIKAGLRCGESAIVIATPEHRSALEAHLNQHGLELAALRAASRYISLDAAETLATFMVNGMPDPALFETHVGSVVRRAAEAGQTVRAFGEMVALLWNQGNATAAVRLEELWNGLKQNCSFSLFCAYPLSAFRGENNSVPMFHVCSQHSRVIPAESYAKAGDPGDRLRAIALLQQKAASLEPEVAERKHAESRVREKQTRLAMAVAVAQLGIWELDLITHDLTCSDQCKAHFGLRPEEPLTFERLFDLVHPDDRETVRNTLRNAIAINGDHSSEYRVIDPSGRTRWISSLGRCFHNGEHRMLGVTLDITERKQNAEILEQTVAERTAKLKETVNELESFSYSISHDMRAPLRSMQGFAAILLEECADEISAEGRACVERITAAAERMDRLIQDVLAFSRVARGDFATEPVDLDGIVKGVIESHLNLQQIQMRGQSPSRTARSPLLSRASIVVDGKLPRVLGNRAGLTQCFSNLLSNAVKFVAPGTSPQVRVWSEALSNGSSQSVRICVQDNGVGIPSQSHEKIFEIFHRLSKKYEGTGVGLAIVKKAVERMGGKVGLTSAPGRGSTFWLELRLAN